MNKFRGEGGDIVNWVDLMPFPGQIEGVERLKLSETTARMLCSTIEDLRIPFSLKGLLAPYIQEANRKLGR
jgi:hypothetical protein